jgi:hypothetical protein
MAMRVSDGVVPIKCSPGTDRGGSRPKPPKAVAQRAGFEATQPRADHKKSKRHLTDKTVAFSFMTLCPIYKIGFPPVTAMVAPET